MNKMKKIICVLLALSTVSVLSGCTKKDNTSNKSQTATTGVNDLLNSQNASSFDYSESSIDGKKTVSELKKKDVGSVDTDLTGLNANMIYSEINSMMTEPSKYEGKTVKMNGTFYVYEDPVTSKKYFSCFVADAAACCSQGLEFELTDDYSYPADYPNENDPITVSGTFETYMEGENKYCHLKNAVFTN